MRRGALALKHTPYSQTLNTTLQENEAWGRELDMDENYDPQQYVLVEVSCALLL